MWLMVLFMAGGLVACDFTICSVLNVLILFMLIIIIGLPFRINLVDGSILSRGAVVPKLLRTYMWPNPCCLTTASTNSCGPVIVAIPLFLDIVRLTNMGSVFL